MPAIYGSDKKGRYIKYGKSGAKYYYKSPAGRKRALKKALKQGRAMHSN